MSEDASRVLFASLVVALFAGGLIAGMGMVGACLENLHPGTDRTRICNTMEAGPWWWALVLAPTLLILSHYLGPLRRRPILVALAVAVPAAALWTYVLLIATGDIGDTRIG